MLREEGFEVRVVNATQEKVKDIVECDTILVGSGIQVKNGQANRKNSWTSSPESTTPETGMLSEPGRRSWLRKFASGI